MKIWGQYDRRLFIYSVGAQTSAPFGAVWMGYCTVCTLASSSLHMDIIVIGLPTELMWALRILAWMSAAEYVWNRVLSFAVQIKHKWKWDRCVRMHACQAFVWEDGGRVWHTQIRAKLAIQEGYLRYRAVFLSALCPQSAEGNCSSVSTGLTCAHKDNVRDDPSIMCRIQCFCI